MYLIQSNGFVNTTFMLIFFNWSNAKINLLKRLLNAINSFLSIISLSFVNHINKTETSCQIKNPPDSTLKDSFLILQRYWRVHLAQTV